MKKAAPFRGCQGLKRDFIHKRLKKSIPRLGWMMKEGC
ncbi:hypothetical protein NOC27_68 [Nitrosococcus oceani AFC27]|nr:hypothetical protein NOC27_68 [Nitrosococcus oceani AFC27]